MATTAEVRRCTPGHRRVGTPGAVIIPTTHSAVSRVKRRVRDTTPPINRDRQNNAHPRHGDFNCTRKKSGKLNPEFEALSG